MGLMTGDKAGQGKTLKIFCAWYCVVIYALFEALQCHAEKCQDNFWYEMVNDPLCMRPIKAEQKWLLVETITLVS